MQVWISGVRNQTHLVYAASWLRSLDGDIDVRVIDAGGFLARGIVQPEQFTRWLGDVPGVTVSFPDRIDVADGPVIYIAIGNPGLKPLAALRRQRPLGRLPVIVVDEGIGSYGTPLTHWAALSRQGTNPLKRVVRVAAARAARMFTTTRWPLYERVTDGWDINERVAAEFRRVQPDPAGALGVVYLSQPWPQLGVVSRDDYLAHLADIAAVVEGAGYEFAVKLHPMEDPADYDAAGIPRHDSTLPAELDERLIASRAVLGATSTGLLNLAAVRGMPAWRVRFDALDAIDKGLGKDQASLLDAFVPPPATLSEIAARLG